MTGNEEVEILHINFLGNKYTTWAVYSYHKIMDQMVHWNKWP